MNEEKKVEQLIDMKLSMEKWPETRGLPSPWGGAHPKYPNEYNNARRKINKDIAKYLSDVSLVFPLPLSSFPMSSVYIIYKKKKISGLKYHIG